jgi:hypothetical protein
MANMEGISPAARQALERLQERYPDLNITSAFRSPEYNTKVGGAKHSEHINGNAFDFSTAGMSEEEIQELTRRALDGGFNAAGHYDGSMHFDVGAPRSWGSSYSSDTSPEWLKAMIAQRAQGGDHMTPFVPGKTEMGQGPEDEGQEEVQGDSTLEALFGKMTPERKERMSGLDASKKGLFGRGDDGSMNVFGRALDKDQRANFGLGLARAGNSLMGL